MYASLFEFHTAHSRYARGIPCDDDCWQVIAKSYRDRQGLFGEPFCPSGRTDRHGTKLIRRFYHAPVTVSASRSRRRASAFADFRAPEITNEQKNRTRFRRVELSSHGRHGTVVNGDRHGTENGDRHGGNRARLRTVVSIAIRIERYTSYRRNRSLARYQRAVLYTECTGSAVAGPFIRRCPV